MASIIPVASAEAFDDRDVTIAMQSPVQDATVAGVVEVTYTVTAPAGTPIGDAAATFAGARHTVDLAGQDCSAGCANTTTFDTSTAPSPWTSEAARGTDDGSQVFGAQVDVNGTWVSTSVGVVLDNHRPTVVVEGMGGGGLYPLTADDSITIKAYPTAHDGGAITAMYYDLGNSEAPMTAPAAAGGPWTYTIDTSASLNTWVSTAVRAVDDRGVQNIGTRVAYVIDHGPTISTGTIADPVKDDDLSSVQLAYSYGYLGTPPETMPERVVTLLDGTPVHTNTDMLFAWQHPGSVLGISGVRVPGGQHTLTYVVTDSRGASGSIDVPVNVTETLVSAFVSGPGTAVLPGDALPVTATATTTNSTLWLWELAVDGVPLVSGGRENSCTSDCPTTFAPETTVRSDVPGTHKLELTVTPLTGYPTTIEDTFTVLPYAVGTVLATTATYGRPVTLHGLVRLTGGARAAGAAAVLQRRSYGSTTWQDVGTATADSMGNLAFTTTAGRSDSYRWTTVTEGGGWARKVGIPVVVPSRAAIAMRQAPTLARRGKDVLIAARVTPVPSASTRVMIQRLDDGRWVSVAVVWRRTSTGAISWLYHPRTAGKQRLRVVRPAGGGLLRSVGPAWTMKVER